MSERRLNIVQFFPGKIWGGAEQFILDFSRQLSVMGHNVTFIARDVEPLHSMLDTEREFTTVYIPTSPLKRSSIAGIIARTLSNADILHIHDVSWVNTAVKAKKLAASKTRLVLTRHIARSSRTLPWRRGAFLHLHRLLFVSDFARDMWMQVNSWMPKDKVITVTNSIPALQAKPVKSLREVYKIDKDIPLLVYCGRVRKSKGCETIIRALSRLKDKDFAMVFLGASKPANYHEHLASIAQKEGIAEKIHFYGFTSDARQLISDADIGLAPSIVRESFHLSPIEFMQQGITVITSDNGAQPGYITDGETGMLVHPDDDEALAKKIATLIENKPLNKNIGRKAKSYFENYLSYQAFINKMMNVYNVR